MDGRERELLTELVKNRRAIERYRRTHRLEFYNRGEKVHAKQLEFHKCPRRNRWVFGGNRTGKTECGAAEAAWLLRGTHPYRPNRPDCTGWAVSVSLSVQREVAQKKLLAYLAPEWIADIGMLKGKTGDESGIVDYVAVRNAFGGISRLYFKSCEMGREKFQGASVDFVWFDEEPPEEIYNECRMRVLDTKGDLFGTMTPLLGLTFAYGKLYRNEANDPEIWHIFMEWSDNPHLDPREIERLSAALEGSERESRRYGRFSSARGLVYPEFDERATVIPPFDVPAEWQDQLSIDPGLNNPLSCHWYAVDGDGNVYVTAEHYAAGKDVSWHCEAIQRISAALNWHCGFDGRLHALIDSAAGQRTLAYSKSVAQLFYEQGIAVNPKVNKDLFTGIARVKEYLNRAPDKPRLYIFDTCVNLIREIKGYWWGEGDVPKKKDDHALDEMRYYLMSRPRFKAAAEQKGELAQFKDRLAGKRKK